ncbi:MAG: MipA/OmpV family protein [Saccharospirillum sp.]|nr:MipA/OmpV family protein [Saccharospirillum sp.]
MHSSTSSRASFCYLLLSSLLSSPVAAVEWSIGAGATVSPAYPGAEQWRVLPAPTFSLSYEGLSVQTRGPGLVFDLVPSQRFSAGPLIRYSGGRDDDFLRGDLDALARIPASAEAGLSLSSGVPLFLISDRLVGIATLGLDWVASLPGGYDGYTLTLGGGYILPMTDSWTLIGSLGVTYQDADYADQWFSVSDVEASSGPLEAFSAREGWNDRQISLVASYRFDEAWSMALVGVNSRYQADAARSPVTRLSDSLDRYLIAFGLSYRSNW